MRVLAHRGNWYRKDEQNTIQAFTRAFQKKIGIETDIRDYKGELVISHNIPDLSCISFTQMCEVYKASEADVCLALNVKADGLAELVEEKIKEYEITNYFLFDMSIPEMVVYEKKHINFFSRKSDLEIIPVLYERANGIWMDEWNDSWISVNHVEQCLRDNKKVGIISPEIHHRNYDRLWKMLKQIKSDNVFLCTDLIDEAKEYFE